MLGLSKLMKEVCTSINKPSQMSKIGKTILVNVDRCHCRALFG